MQTRGGDNIIYVWVVTHWHETSSTVRKSTLWAPARRAFLGKRLGIPAGAGHIKFYTITLWTQESQDAFYLRKHKNSGRVAARHVFLGKRCGIRERLAAAHINLLVESHSPQNAFCLKNKRNLGGSSTTRVRSVAWHIIFWVKINPRRILCGIHNDSPRLVAGWWRGCILIRNRDGV